MARKRRFFGKNVDKDFDISLARNNRTYQHYYKRLLELAISMFEWKNLPSTVDERYLEWVLCHNGLCTFFEDDVLGHLALKCTNNGKLDVYMKPTKFRAIASNGYNHPLNRENSVLIYNNYLHTNTIDELELFAYRLYDIDMTIFINARVQKTPALIQGDENTRLSLLNAYKEFDGNMPVIFADNKLNPKAISVLKTDAPFVADKLYQLKTEIWNEALTYLGISNINIQKKERLVSDEVVRSQGGTISSRHSRLQMRRQACEEINKMFNLDIEVNYREDFREADDEVMFIGNTGDNTQVDMVHDIRTK